MANYFLKGGRRSVGGVGWLVGCGGGNQCFMEFRIKKVDKRVILP